MKPHTASWLAEHLNALKKQSQFRSLSPIQAREGAMALLEEKAYLNLSGNDYLGLATRMDLQNEFQTQHLLPALEKPGFFTSSSSRLLTGNHALYTQLEEQLSRWSGMESALVFSSGYHANLGIIPALASHGDIIFSDKLNHASIQDALKLSDTKFIRYPHLDYDKLESLLQIHRSTHKKALIVSESLFSMDGDRADLKRLVELKNRYNCMLYVDEAHAAGVFGDKGIGLCEEEGILNEVDILVGTFGKALASFGAYALCSLTMKDYLINTARSLIFTTALPPMNLLWTGFILEKIPGLHKERRHLAQLSNKLRKTLKKEGFAAGGDSQIIPVLIGDNDATLQLSRRLRLEHGLLVFAIRPPTVPTGTSRLRLSLSAAMDFEELKALPQLIKEAITPCS